MPWALKKEITVAPPSEHLKSACTSSGSYQSHPAKGHSLNASKEPSLASSDSQPPVGTELNNELWLNEVQFKWRRNINCAGYSKVISIHMCIPCSRLWNHWKYVSILQRLLTHCSGLQTTNGWLFGLWHSAGSDLQIFYKKHLVILWHNNVLQASKD